MTKFGFVTYDIQTPHGLVFIIYNKVLLLPIKITSQIIKVQISLII